MLEQRFFVLPTLGTAAMHYRLILWSTLLVLPMLVEAQESVAPATPTERSEPSAVLEVDEPTDPRILERFELPDASDTLSRTILVDPGTSIATDGAVTDETQPENQPAATAAVTVNLGAVRSRVVGTVADIQVVREGRSLEESIGDSQTVTLKRGDILAVRTDQMQPPPGLGAVAMPSPSSSTVLYTLDESGHPRELGLFHRSAGLHWRGDRARFIGELLVGILDRENPSARGSLDEVTIPVQLLAPPGTLDRTDIELVRIGTPFERVAVATDLSTDPFPVELISQVDPDLQRAELRVFRPQLALSGPSAIQGLGVDEAVVTVSGTDLRPGETLTLELDNGWLADSTVVAEESGTASTRIRSDWLGSGTLRLLTPPYEATPKEIRYTAPLRFVAATLLGAVLGAFVLVYMLKRNEPAVERSYKADWIIGVIIGAGATTMAYAGMKLPEWIPVPPVLAGEVAPFALAFICAAGGAAIIHSIVGAARKPVTG